MNKFLIALFLLILSAGNGLSLTLKFAEFSPNRGIRAEALKNFAKKIENQKWIQKNKQDGAYLYKKYLTLLEKYQKIKQTQGYPWEL